MGILYKVMGVPTAWSRCAPGYKGQLYDTQKHIKNVYSITMQSQHRGPIYQGVPLELCAKFVFPMPLSRKKDWDKLRGTPHIFKPDTSNLVKFIEDSMKGILIKDDRIIWKLTVEKIYGDEATTEFMIKPYNVV